MDTITTEAGRERTWRDYKNTAVLAPQPPEDAKLVLTTPECQIRLYKHRHSYYLYYGLQVITDRNFVRIMEAVTGCLEHHAQCEGEKL